MALKPADLLNQLPSVSELLEKPPIRALADRWNRSVVAGGVKSFLDEMRSEVRRRAGNVPMPSLRELAERAARYIVSQQQQSLGTAINATGRLRGADWRSRPLPEAALERIVAVGREFALETSPSNGARRGECEPALCRHTGAAAAVPVHSYAGALWLAFATLAAEREVLVARAEVAEVEPGEPLTRLAAAAGVALREVGAIDRATATEFEAMVTTKTAAVLTTVPDAYRVVGDTTTAELDQLVGLCRASELVLIDALGAGPLSDPPEPLNWPLRSARSSLAAGVDLVVVRGDGLVGGPACGILLGDRETIDRVEAHPLFAAWRLDILRSAALAATLECYDHQPASQAAIPAWQVLAVSVENLRNRAERLAPQLAHVEGVGSATAVETRSPLFAALTDGCSSYGVALTAADGDIQSLDRRLRSCPLPIFGRVEADRLVLDLRTVLARQDMALVDSLLGSAEQQAGDSNRTEPARTP